MKRSLKTAMVIVWLALFLGCTPEVEEPVYVIPPAESIGPSYSTAMNPEDAAVAEVAFDIFRQSCRPLMTELTGCIERIEIEPGLDCTNNEWADSDYRCTDYKWSKYYYIRLKLINRTQQMPDWPFFGHTEHIYIGGSQNPGISVTKFPKLCGATDPAPGSNGFLSTPGLANLF